MESSHYGSSQGFRCPYPRGGPVYEPDAVGPLTSPVQFESIVVQELQLLEEEMRGQSATEFEAELSVEELKVFTDEELVEKALTEAFKDTDQEREGCTLQDGEMRTDDQRVMDNSQEGCDASVSVELLCHGNSQVRVDSQNDVEQRTPKRARGSDRGFRAAELEGSCFKKVWEYAEIKKKQDADKKAARLYSFSGCADVVRPPISITEKNERLRSLKSIMHEIKAKSANPGCYMPLICPDVVITIEVYHNRKMNLKVQEFLVLGRQTLTDLRDNICCVTDELMKKADVYDPSGYFLIEDVFCSDHRSSSCVDYSEPIFDWLKNKQNEALEKWGYTLLSAQLGKKQKSLLGNEKISQLPNFRAVEMQNTKFCDLKFRLGCGYLYCHQGNCKHIIIFRDMRLVHAEDAQNMAAYPILAFQHRQRFQKCSICKIYLATKVTVDDKWAEKNPSFFCDTCYFLLHYSEEKKLLYDEFTVYDYHHE